MQVLNWFVKGVLSYVHVKGKAHASKPTLVSTTPVVHEVAAFDEDRRALRDAASGRGEGQRCGATA